ncbi:hypothetical protein C8R44DRAFT_761477 [Mycena epipterygia]|nr:hypothetical protein C8R44DRAFT_761477 [Mycena epipterygia]
MDLLAGDPKNVHGKFRHKLGLHEHNQINNDGGVRNGTSSVAASMTSTPPATSTSFSAEVSASSLAVAYASPPSATTPSSTGQSPELTLIVVLALIVGLLVLLAALFLAVLLRRRYRRRNCLPRKTLDVEDSEEVSQTLPAPAAQSSAPGAIRPFSTRRIPAAVIAYQAKRGAKGVIMRTEGLETQIQPTFPTESGVPAPVYTPYPVNK